MNYSMFYSQNFRKPIRVKLSNGKEFIGMLDGHILGEDNEPYGESIIIETNTGVLIELYINEIANITIDG